MAAEMSPTGRAVRMAIGFNEAAANGRGNGRKASRTNPRKPSFNEAAANGRGNARPSSGARRESVASMRPRRMAAEIRTTTCSPSPRAGFNEAAANGRGNMGASG